MVITSDGSNAWSLSASGLTYLPISTLYNYPIISPSSTQVFLSENPCNPGLAQGTVQMTNLGGGKLTYAITTISPTLTAAVSSGVAPSTITFTMEPGRVTTYTRLAGTNLVTGTSATLSGQSLDIAIASPQAINLPPVIRVYMNYRQSDQRGVIYPIPVTPNNSPNATTVTTTTTLIAGDQGLEDIVLDQPRNRVYISNAGYNRIEVFDTVNQVLLTPIPVNQMPHQMAMSTDGNTLYVASTGGELIDMVNLNIGKDIGHISFPPIPRQAGGQTAALFYPQAMAVGSGRPGVRDVERRPMEGDRRERHPPPRRYSYENRGRQQHPADSGNDARVWRQFQHCDSRRQRDGLSLPGLLRCVCCR